ADHSFPWNCGERAVRPMKMWPPTVRGCRDLKKKNTRAVYEGAASVQWVDDRTLRIAVLLSAHIIFLSAGALRILRGERGHLLRSQAPWYLQYYPPLVWIPFVVAYFFPVAVDLPMTVRLAGLRSEERRVGKACRA